MREDEIKVSILEQALLAGNTYANACEYSGISESTYHRWMREGAVAPEGTLARKFWQRIKKAVATCNNRNVLIIQKAAAKNWQAAAWFLERRYPNEWGRKDAIRLGGDGSGMPIVNASLPVKTLTDQETMSSLALILERARDRAAAKGISI